MSEPARILLAEDDRILRKAGEVALRKKGYAVLAAVDGEEALAKAREHKPTGHRGKAESDSHLTWSSWRFVADNIVPGIPLSAGGVPGEVPVTQENRL